MKAALLVCVLLGSSVGAYAADPVQKHCQKEMDALAGLPLGQHELALLEANVRLLTWFSEYQEKPGVSPQDQKWSYVTWSIGTYLLGQHAYRSPRVQLLLLGFSENATDFLRKGRTFEQFYAENEALAVKSDRLRKTLSASAPNFARESSKQIKALAECAQTTGMMAATQKSKLNP